MTKKRKLSDLVREETQQLNFPPEPAVTESSDQLATESQTTKLTESQKHEVTESQSNKVTNSTQKQPKLQNAKVTELRTDKLTNPRTMKQTELQTTETTESASLAVPKYLTLVRKETRLREDQIDQLTVLVRKLNRQRQGGERLTENSLIRVAVDLLLSQSQDLRGTTEEELRAALDLEDTE